MVLLMTTYDVITKLAKQQQNSTSRLFDANIVSARFLYFFQGKAFKMLQLVSTSQALSESYPVIKNTYYMACVFVADLTRVLIC